MNVSFLCDKYHMPDNFAHRHVLFAASESARYNHQHDDVANSRGVDAGMVKLTIRENIRTTGGKGLRFSPDGFRFVSIDSGKFHVWENNRVILTEVVSKAHINRPHFTPDGEKLHIGTVVFDIELKQFLARDDDNSTVIRTRTPLVSEASAWTPDFTHLIIYERFFPSTKITEDNYTGIRSRLLVKDAESRHTTAVLLESEQRNDYYTLEASEQVIVAGGYPSYVWQRETREQIAELYAHKTTISDLRFYNDGSFLLSADWQGHVVMWDAVTWAILANWVAHENGTWGADFHPTQPYVATCGDDNTVRLWDIAESPTIIAELATNATPIDLAIHPSGNSMVVSLEGNGMLFIDIVE